MKQRNRGHGSQSNSVTQGDNSANGGNGGTATGGNGGYADTGNTQEHNGNAEINGAWYGPQPLSGMHGCGCDDRGSEAEGGDTYAGSGDAEGGDGGDASADGGDGGEAFNVAEVWQSNDWWSRRW